MSKPKPNQLETNPKTPPLKQLNFKVHPDFYWKLKNFATSKRLKMPELLEKSFNFYQKREQIINEINNYRQSIQAIEKQMQTFQGNMNLEEFRFKIDNLNSIPFNEIGLITTHEILREVLEEYLRVSKKNLEANSIKPIPNWSLN